MTTTWWPARRGYYTELADLRSRRPDIQSEVYESELNCMATVRSGSSLRGQRVGSLYLFNKDQYGLHSDQFPGHPDAVNPPERTDNVGDDWLRGRQREGRVHFPTGFRRGGSPRGSCPSRRWMSVGQGGHRQHGHDNRSNLERQLPRGNGL